MYACFSVNFLSLVLAPLYKEPTLGKGQVWREIICSKERILKREAKGKIDSELNDLRKIICLRKSESSVERISVCNVIENVAEHGMHLYQWRHKYVIVTAMTLY